MIGLSVLAAAAPGAEDSGETPRGIEGLSLWLDAAAFDATLDAPSPVTEWPDGSGRGSGLRQEEADRRPTAVPGGLNGHTVLKFDGTQTFLRGPGAIPAGANAYTVAVVWCPDRIGTAQAVFDQAGEGLRTGERAAVLAVADRYGFNGESNDCHDLVPLTPKEWRLTLLEVDNSREANVRLLDNGQVFEGKTGNRAGLHVGAAAVSVGRKCARDGEYLAGMVAEILVFDRVLPRNDRNRLQAYLDSKWGLDTVGAFRTPEGKRLLFDFDGEDYGEWEVEGTAFGTAPASGTLAGQMTVSGHRGTGLANSYHGGDGATGTLLSPLFVIEKRFIRFLIGGGKKPGKACLELLVDGTPVREATGPNDRPGGSEHLDPAQWDVTEFIGRTARLRIRDLAQDGWGHINVDHITQTDRKLPAFVDAVREFAATARYLLLPVRTGAPKKRMRVLRDGEVVREFEIEFDAEQPEFRVFLDLSPFAGDVLRLEADRLPEESAGLAAAIQADEIRDVMPLYGEPLRPQFHFTSRRGWNNDPNGLVYHDGEYHLFYQHNPYGWSWGNMHWGHAVSTDLVHWRELPIAIYPREFGDWAFSGGAIVDRGNSAGFGTGTEDVLVAAYTSTGRGECIAFSTDRGRTFTDFAGNPVVKHVGRDPKIIRYEPDACWVMAVYDEYEDKRWIAFYRSPDLKTWTFASRVEGYFECPEIFELPVIGDPGSRKWVLYAADGAYAVGTFDGTTFTPEQETKRYNYGNCFYASQTFSDIPAADGRRIQIGWGTVATPGMPFNQMMTFPVELTLHATEGGLHLAANPVREIERLHGQADIRNNVPLTPGVNPVAGLAGELWHITAEFSPGEATAVAITVRGTEIRWDAKEGTLSCRDRKAPLRRLADGRIRLEILADRTSLEVFGNDGLVYMPMGVIAPADDLSVAVSCTGSGAVLTRWSARQLVPAVRPAETSTR